MGGVFFLATPAQSLPGEPTLVGTDQIASTVAIGGVPPAQHDPGIPAIPQTLKADLRQEYVSAGGYIAYINYARALPRAIDDLTTDFGDDLYNRMLLDPQVSSVINVLRASVLEDGVTFNPAVSDESDPDHAQAKTLAEWVTKAMAVLTPSLDVVLWDLCEAFAVGNRVAELVWDVRPDPTTGRPALLLKAIKPKPRESTSFVVDSYNNLLGLLALEVGRAYPVQTNIYVTDLDTIPNLLPREKFCVLTFREKDGDPRGSTPLRAAWDPWWLAKQARGEYLKYIAQFASPSVIGITPEDAEPALTDAVGNPLQASQIVTPETAMATQLATLRNGTALSFPFGSEVKPLTMAGDGSAFASFEDRQDRRIAKAILNQMLATEEGKHQTRASSGTHQDILDTIVRQTRRTVERMLAEQVVHLLILFNFGADALPFAPIPTLGRTEQHDFSSMAGGVAALESSGFLGESQKPGIDNLLGLPVRDVEADALAAQKALQTAQAMAMANPANTGAQRLEEKQMAGGQVSGDRSLAGQQAAKPDKPQANPGAQSGTEGDKGGE